MPDAITTERSGSTLIVRFVRPEIRNPLSIAVIKTLDGIVDDRHHTDGIDRVVFTGSGDVFASGADLREIAAVKPDEAAAFALRGQSLMAKIVALPVQTIAAVNGYCFGGALDLALACDVRIASRSAKFAHPGSGLGIITGWGGTQRLPRLVGRGVALEMFFSAAPIDAKRALEIGLIDAIAEDALAAALAYGSDE